MFYFIAFMAATFFIYGYVDLKKNKEVLGQASYEVPASRQSKEEIIIHSPLDHKDLMKEIFQKEEFQILLSRVENVEGAMFQNLLNWEEEKGKLLAQIDGIQEIHTKEIQDLKESFLEERALSLEDKFQGIEKKEAMPLKKAMPPHIRAVVEYEKAGKSLSEIATLTKMNKGEVLLLRNLSKHYEA